jgi:hypothetical protein
MKPVSFTHDLTPIFTASCSGCHSTDKKKGGLDLSTYKALMAGSKEGPVVTPGHPEKSDLVSSISGPEPDMPKKGDKLTKAQVETITRWVQQGAIDDTPVAPIVQAGHGTPGPAPITKTPIYAAAPVITALSFSPDGKTLAISGYHEVLLYSAANWKMEHRLLAGSPRIESIAYSADGKMLASSGGSPALFGQIHIWNTADQKLIGNYQTAKDSLFGLSFSPDGEKLAFGCTDKSARVISVKTGGELLRLDQHSDWCLGALFTADGKRLLTGSRDKAMKLTDVSNGQFIDDVNNPLEAVLCMARHPKEDLVLYGGDAGTARIYKIKDNQARTAGRNDTNLVRAFERQNGAVHSVAWNADGSQVVLGSLSEARIYDVKDGKRLATLSGIDGAVFAVAFSPTAKRVAVGGYDGKVHIYCSGCGELLKTFDPAPIQPSSAQAAQIGFVRDVEPIMAKVGCNAGTCHGSAKGKEGFKLSLRGYDTDFDYQAFIEDLSGRRFNRENPDQSLMLLKPAGMVPHEGGKVLAADSEYYKVIREWIAQGTKPQSPSARATSLEVIPEVINLDLPGKSQQLKVIAHYSDGAKRDVTNESIITTNNIEAIAIKENTVTALRRGEGAALVRYEGNYATRPVFIMGDRTGYAWEQLPQFNYIDKLVDAKLEKMKIVASPLCTDADFVRRVTLDLTGQPASAERTKAFLADPAHSIVKREKLVDELLASDGFVDRWTNKWADLLQCNSKTLGPKAMWTFHNWIHDQVEANRPYDQFVRDILLAQGSSYHVPQVNYYRTLKEVGKITEDVSQTFLGVRFNCNKCHDHPFEKWTQTQYYEFGAYFARVAFKKGSLPEEEVVYNNFAGGEVHHLKTDMVMKPHVPYGAADETSDSGDRRTAFVHWLTSAENPYFAESMANRLWSYFFNRGIIDPVDDIRASNPASNPELLEALTQDFIDHKFDVKHLMRTICLSRTYQLSVAANKWNEDDKINFSHAMPRRLSAEQLVDAVAIATGYHPRFSGMPADMRAADLPDGTGEASDVLGLFGKPKRQSACECERTSNFTLSHAINLVNGSTIDDAVSAPNTRITRILEKEQDDRKVVEELYYAILNRPPTSKELAETKLGQGPKRAQDAQDLAWALLNSAAFLYNH